MLRFLKNFLLPNGKQKKVRPTSRNVRPAVESLERRDAPAAVFLNNQTIEVFGTPKADKVVIDRANVNGVDAYRVNLNGNVYAFKASSVCAIVGHFGNGNDNVSVSGNVFLPTTLFGEAGNDRISGGSGPDLILGGAGHDVLLGNAGKDRVFGEAGIDTLYGGGDKDYLSGGLNGCPAPNQRDTIYRRLFEDTVAPDPCGWGDWIKNDPTWKPTVAPPQPPVYPPPQPPLPTGYQIGAGHYLLSPNSSPNVNTQSAGAAGPKLTNDVMFYTSSFDFGWVYSITVAGSNDGDQRFEVRRSDANQTDTATILVSSTTYLNSDGTRTIAFHQPVFVSSQSSMRFLVSINGTRSNVGFRSFEVSSGAGSVAQHIGQIIYV